LKENLSDGVAIINKANQHIKVQKTTTTKKKIAMIFDTDVSFWDPTKREALKAADIYGYEVSFYAPTLSGVERIKEMAGFLDKALEDKCEGIVISPIDDELIYQKLKKLNSMGTKIVFINSKINHIDYISLIQTDGIAAGAAAARVVMGVMGGQGEVIVNTWSDMQISAIENRKTGFIQELRKHTSIKIHEAAVHSKPSLDETKTIDAILRSYPAARIIYLTNCEWGQAVARYLEKHHTDIQVMTIDFTLEIQEAMSKGFIHYAIGQRAYSWGSMAISFIDRSIHNKPVKKYIDTGTYEVNQQNMNIYKSNLS
jgi:ABC-type sugar transport system substrate-binding protein